MKSISFSVEELSIIRIYAHEGFTRQSVLANLEGCLEYVSDRSLWETVSSLANKLDDLSDEEFATLELDVG